ncbi:MAG: EexN family lipoprotein [Methylococcales bacterium]
MKKGNLIMLVAAVLTLLVTVFKISNAEDNKTVAWYSANIKVAQAKNKECYDNPTIKSSPDCLNAQHALEISFGLPSK